MPSPVQSIDPATLEPSEKAKDPLSGLAVNVWNSVSGFFSSIKDGADDYSKKSLGLDDPKNIPIDRRTAEELVTYRRSSAPAAQLNTTLLLRSVELLIITYFVGRLVQSCAVELEKLLERAVARFEHKEWVAWTVGEIQKTANAQTQQGWLQGLGMFASFAPDCFVTPSWFKSARDLFADGNWVRDYIPTDAVTINSWQKQAQTACGQVPMVIQGWTQTAQMIGQSRRDKGTYHGQSNEQLAQSAARGKQQAKKEGDDDMQAAVNLIQSTGQIARQAASAA